MHFKCANKLFLITRYHRKSEEPSTFIKSNFTCRTQSQIRQWEYTAETIEAIACYEQSDQNKKQEIPEGLDAIYNNAK